ncbi:MAG: hypothetical protein AUK29_01645 [Nitrospirae bacterium CG2_30_53_67]
MAVHVESLPPNLRKVIARLRPVVRAHGFILAGGTGLALQLGHRISEDLDFFTTEDFSTENLFQALQAERVQPEIMQEAQGTLTVLANEVKTSFFHYPYPFPEPKARWNGISISGIADIAGMKVISISQRGARRDFVDLYFILQSLPFFQVAENMIRRFGWNRIHPLHIGKSLVYFEDAESDPDPRYCGKKKPSWEFIKRFFTRNVQQIVLDLESAREAAP